MKNDQTLLASNRFTINYEPNTGDIEININFVKPIDTGLYKCKATNIYGEDETRGNMFILNVPNIDERPQTLNPDAFKNLELPFIGPKIEDINDEKYIKEGKPPKFIINLPNNVKVRDGEKYQTLCKVSGYPYPKVFNDKLYQK
jgi:hypothetical protein